jgi:hypothetical protein
MDVRLSAQFGPLKRPKRLGGRPAEATWACQKQPPLPLDSSVHESHQIPDHSAAARPPLSHRLPPSGRRHASRNAAPPLPGCRLASAPEGRPVSARSSPSLRPVPATAEVPGGTGSTAVREENAHHLPGFLLYSSTAWRAVTPSIQVRSYLFVL